MEKIQDIAELGYESWGTVGRVAEVMLCLFVGVCCCVRVCMHVRVCVKR